MDRIKSLGNHPELIQLFKEFKNLYLKLESEYLEQFSRSLPISELLNDRWERAKRLGFGQGTSIYDSSLVFGKPSIGENCWIGPFTIIDGSGGLQIGNSCTISAGAHIYTHDNLKATLNPAATGIERSPVIIGDNCYIGPHSIVSRGVVLGDCCVVAANSLVNKSFESFSIVGGNPARLLGRVEFHDDAIVFNYLNAAE